MFRAHGGRRRRVWHFCVNCPSWPEDYETYETCADPPFERWCKTCVRMYEADTGWLEDSAEWFPSSVFLALSNAWAAGKLRLKGEPPLR